MSLLQLNIHPILVHFPIALLSLYSFLELISFGRLKNNESLFITKAILVCIGGISVLVALASGSTASHQVSDQSLRPLIREHEFFGKLVAAIYGIIAAGYVFAVFKRWLQTTVWYRIGTQLWNFIFYIGYLLTQTFAAKLLAIAGFIALLITGALGGAIVYGANLDPLTSFIYHLFFTQ